MRGAHVEVERMSRRVDHNALRTNQLAIVLFVVAGFLTDTHWLVGVVGAVLALGAADPRAALFQQFYHRALKGRFLRPDVREDDLAPHRFAQGVGAVFLLSAAFAMWAGASVVGWAVAWIVAVLAAVNLIFGFCAGCFVYVQLTRLGWIRPGGKEG
ncbi:MAG: DUF4395 domain-containing protein [Armatimonadota bacterium]|nr:DUF4395 domain-containing protein [Armatimonadota bacterium]MDR5696288.1 DUF4395 domain-containing protein [Armatimonadota bacterium]